MRLRDDGLEVCPARSSFPDCSRRQGPVSPPRWVVVDDHRVRRRAQGSRRGAGAPRPWNRPLPPRPSSALCAAAAQRVTVEAWPFSRARARAAGRRRTSGPWCWRSRPRRHRTGSAAIQPPATSLTPPRPTASVPPAQRKAPACDSPRGVIWARIASSQHVALPLSLTWISVIGREPRRGGPAARCS